MTQWPPISRDDLRHAAKSAGFDTTFPLLIRRLIAETAEGLTGLDMPGGSGTAAGGFDGVVIATGQSTFVPAGTSVWELSVGGGNAKAEEDYDKRTTAPDGLPTQQVTYVAGLLEPWTKARAFATAKHLQGRWRQVHGYNLDRIHAWLDVAPATTAWLAGQLGRSLPGVLSVEGWWTNTWLPSTRVPLDRAVVLAGREKAATDLMALLATGQHVITLGGDLRQDEARSFVAASLEAHGALDSVPIAARTLFVSDATSLSQLVVQQQPLILLLSDPTLARDLTSLHPHKLIVTAPPRGQGDIDVPRVHSQAVETRLLSTGLTRDEAVRFGTLARRSLLALQRSLAHNPVLTTPSWAAQPDRVRRRLLLVGSWAAGNQEDRRIVSDCVGLPYEQIQEEALRLAASSEVPFLAEIDALWHLLSVDDAWTLLASSITSDDLEALRTAVKEVFAERNPVLDLDPDEQWKAGITGVKPRYSRSLRDGLAQSLALLGASGATILVTGGVTGGQWVHLLLRELLADANADDTYRLWASLGSELCLLAEAAPGAFLEAMRDGLAGASPLHVAMFTDAAPGPFGMGRSSVHTHFLWAVETLAWSTEHFDDAVDVLGALTALDPGGTWSNRPAASLVGILSAWAPNTQADVSRRVEALKRMMRQQPAVARSLLLDLIPNGNGFQTVHRGPRFRDWSRERSVTHGDLVLMVSSVVELLLDDLGVEPAGYLDMIGKIDVISKEHRHVFAERLTALRALEEGPERTSIFEALRAKITKHREYADAAWALPESELVMLEAAAEGLQPQDPRTRHSWLFGSDWITLGDRSRREDFAVYDAEVLRRRAEAVGEIYVAGGLEQLALLAAATPHPRLVGTALAEYSAVFDNEMLSWLDDDTVPLSEAALAYLARRMYSSDGNLPEVLLSKATTPLAQARILRVLQDPAAAWQRLEGLDPRVAEGYWKEFSYFGLGSDFAHALKAAWSLLDAGRGAAALDLINLYGVKEDSLEAAEVTAAAMEQLLASGLDDPELPRLTSHCFQQLFDLLARHREGVGRQRVVQLEWQLHPALGFDARAPTLHAALAEDPAFFVELVTFTFRPATRIEDEPGSPVALEQRRSLASRAHDVLGTFRTVPGLARDGQLDEVALRSWVDSVRTQLIAVDRLDVGDGQIGELLAFAPPDPDGSVIHKSIRDVLENLCSDHLDRGLGRGIHNRRGMTGRGLLDGGVQEWELAKTFRDEAETAQKWPRTRKLLIGLAESYEGDARREDQEAERRHRGLGR